MPISSGVCTRRWHSVTADATLSSRSSRVLLLVERRMRGPKASASARVSTPCFELLRENLNEGIRSEAVAGAGEEKKEEGRKKKKKRAENWRCWLMPLKITKKRCCSSAPMQKAHEVVRGVQVRAGQRPAAEERRHLRSRCVATLLRLHEPEVPARAVTQVQLWRGVGGAAHGVCEEGLGQLYEPYLKRGGDDVAVCAQRLRGETGYKGETGYNCRRSDGRQR